MGATVETVADEESFRWSGEVYCGQTALADCFQAHGGDGMMKMMSRIYGSNLWNLQQKRGPNADLPTRQLRQRKSGIFIDGRQKTIS